MQKWEYLAQEVSITHTQFAKEGLDSLGAEGWELVEICRERVLGVDSFYGVFKRPVANEEPVRPNTQERKFYSKM